MPAASVSVLTALALLSAFTAQPEAQCPRSDAADRAADLYGEAEDLRFQASTPAQHAEAAMRYEQAVRQIPATELAWAQGTKYVARAHEEYLLAATDDTAPMSERRAWLLADRTLLELYLAAADEAAVTDDPCRDDPALARANVEDVRATLDGLAEPGPVAAEAVPAPEPAPRSGGPVHHEDRRGFLIGGGVTLGLAGVGAVIMTVGLVRASQAAEALPESSPSERAPIFRAGAQGNAMGVAGLAVLGTGMVVGVSLLAVGLTKRRPGVPTASLVPARTGGVLVLEGRF